MRSSFAPLLLVLGGCAPVASPPPPEARVAAAPVAVAPPSPPAQSTSLVHVQVLALNDFHGNLEPPRGHDGSVVTESGERIPAGGAAYLAAEIEHLRAKNPNTVVVSAGDLTGASPLVSSLFQDEPTILVMNRIGLDFEGVGNHDFDRGLLELRRLGTGGARTAAPGLLPPPSDAFVGAHFTYLAANVFDADGKTVFPAYGIKDVGGVKVAFVGLTLEGTPGVTAKEAIRGLTFRDEARTANALLPELRRQGVAAVVILLHQGGFQGKGGSFNSCHDFGGPVLSVLHDLDPAFRVVVTAHTHQAYNCQIDGRFVTSAGSFGRLVTAIDLTIDPAKQSLREIHAENVPVTHDLVPNADVADIVRRYEALAEPVTQKVVGYQRGTLTREPMTVSCETPLGDVIADAQLAATKKAGAVIALINPGGVRTDLVAEGAPKVAPIHYADAFEIQPFGNRLVTLSLTGAALRTLLERQFVGDRPRVLSVSRGFSYSYTFDPATKSVTIDPHTISLAGHVVDPAAHYRITVNSFLADGGDGFSLLRDAPERTVGPLDVDAFVEYLQRTTSPTTPLTPAAKLDRVTGNGCR